MPRTQEKGEEERRGRGERRWEWERKEVGRGSRRGQDTGAKGQIPRRTKSRVG